MKSTTIVMTLAMTSLMAVLVGCSNNSGGSGNGGPTKQPLKPISPASKTAAAEALTGHAAMFETTKATGETAGKNSQVYSQVFAAMSAVNPEGSNPPSDKSDTKRELTQKKSKLKRTLDEAIQGADCQMSPPMAASTAAKPNRPGRPGRPSQPDQGSSSQAGSSIPPMKVVLNGEKCPVDISFEISIDQPQEQVCRNEAGSSLCQFNGKLIMVYRVLDQALKNELGVSFGSMTMKFAMQTETKFPAGSERGSKITAAPPAPVMGNKIKGIFEVEFKVTDLNDKTYVMNGSQEMNVMIPLYRGSPSQPQPNPGMAGIIGSGSLNFRYFVEGTDEGVELIANFKSDGKTATSKYLISGQEVSESVFMEEMAKIENSLMNFGGQNESSAGPSESVPGESVPPGQLPDFNEGEDGGTLPETELPDSGN